MINTATRPLDFAAARRAMIDSQLRTSGVNAPYVMQVMGAVAREEYVPEEAHGYCYMDRAIALPGGGTLAQPVSHGKMLTAARPEAHESVLVIDNGNGYLSALFGALAAKVDTISVTDAAAGKKRGSYDLIVMDGAAEEFPAALAKRLADDGRIVTGLVSNGVTRLAVGRKSGKDIAFRTVEDIALPQLAQFAAAKGWSF